MNDQHQRLILTRTFIKDFKKLSRENQERVRRAFDEIAANPYQGRKVQGAEFGQYRWRVGDLRVRYDIEGMEIRLLRVIKREDVYRKFK